MSNEQAFSSVIDTLEAILETDDLARAIEDSIYLATYTHGMGKEARPFFASDYESLEVFCF